MKPEIVPTSLLNHALALYQLGRLNKEQLLIKIEEFEEDAEGKIFDFGYTAFLKEQLSKQ